MLRLRTFGGLSVAHVDRPLGGASTQPRRLALLAVLARAGERGVPRERLLALFWPDDDEERARRALAQALYALRRDLGDERALVGTHELRLDPEAITSDVAAFAAHARAGRLAEAHALYAGPFLDGFHLPGAPAFARWMDEERRVLEREHARILERLAEGAARDGHAPESAAYWRALAAVDPLDARVTVRLMEALDAAGDRAGALKQARVYEVLVAQELELPPDHAVVALAERLRAAPPPTPPPQPAPVAIPPVPLPDPEPATAPTPVAPIAPVAGPASPRPPRSRLLIGAGVAAMLLGAAALASRGGEPASPAFRLGGSQRLTFEDGLEVDPVLSPDGRLVAYAAGADDAMRLYVRQVGGGRPVAVTAGAMGGSHRYPRWSPDGTQLLFQAERGVWLIPALGGAARPLVEPPRDTLLTAGHADWSPDGREIAYAVGDTALARAADGGTPRVLGVLDDALHSLAWSPDGRWVAAAKGNVGFVFGALPHQRGQVKIGNLAPSSVWLFPARGGGAPVRVTGADALNTSPTWLDGGRVLAFVSDRAGPRDVYAVAVDEAGPSTEAPARLTTGIGAHTVAASRDGRSLIHGVFRMRANVWAVPIDGPAVAGARTAVQVTQGEQTIEGPSISPDGAWLAYDSDRSGRQGLWRLRLDAPGAEPERLVDWPTDVFRPVWSADGAWIAFYTVRDGARVSGVVPSRGGVARLVLPGDGRDSNTPALSPDARRLVFARHPDGSDWELFETTRATAADTAWTPPRRLTRRGGNTPSWSPDGARLAYFAGGALRVMPTDGGGEDASRALLALHDPRIGGALAVFARWLPNGRALVLRALAGDGASTFWRVPIDGGAPRLLARLNDPRLVAVRQEFSTDGRRLYVALAERESDAWMLRLEGGAAISDER